MELVDAAVTSGVDLTFDSYPYSRGCTVFAMLVLPPAFLRQGLDRAAVELAKAEVQDKIVAEWIPVMASRADMGERWADNIRFAHIAAPEFGWAHGLTLAEAAGSAGLEPGVLALQVLAASDLEVSVVMKTPVQRSDADMAGHLDHPAHMGGSDGIFIGQSPHPRGWGTFARYLAVFTAERGDLSWGQAAHRFATAPAAS